MQPILDFCLLDSIRVAILWTKTLRFLRNFLIQKFGLLLKPIGRILIEAEKEFVVGFGIDQPDRKTPTLLIGSHTGRDS